MESLEALDFIMVDDKDLESGNEDLLPQSSEKIQQIQKWLQPTDYLSESSEYQKHLHSYVPGTGNWMRETDPYRKWHDSPDAGSLWTKAIAGAGKSVFAAMIASHLSDCEDVPVLFFFFRQIITTNHHPQSLVRDFISQVLNHSPILQAKMRKYIDERRSLDNISALELWQDLVSALSLLPKVYCIVDALDEMDIDQESFFKNLVDLGKHRPSSIKLLMTSRPLPRVEAILRDPSVLQLRLEESLVDKDIAVYVDHRLRNHPEYNEELRTAIRHEIGAKSKGSFLYSRLMMDELLVGHFPHMSPDIQYLQRSLEWLPVTLEDMYNGMLLDHSLRSGMSQELQVTILKWVTHSSRPLRLLELASMIDLLNGSPGKDTKAFVREACGPLLEILEDETISVIHHSFTEFLTDLSREGRPAPGSKNPQFPVIASQSTQREMALTCLNYLTAGCFSNWEIKKHTPYGGLHNLVINVQTIKMQFPFLDYAMNNWYVHVSKLNTLDQELCSSLDAFTQPESHTFRSWLDLAWGTTAIEKVSPLHLAAWAGITRYAEYLLARGHDANSLDAQLRSPLSWAALKGYTAIVALLLEKNIDTGIYDGSGMQPVHHAARANHSEVVRLLLAAGVSPLTGKMKDSVGRICENSPSSVRHTPLLYATQSGCVESVREMIPYLKIEDLNNVLCDAARSGKAGVIDLLLACPNISVDDHEDTPLFLAARNANPEIMRSLLKKGADPMSRSINMDGRGHVHSISLRNPGDFREKTMGFTPLHGLCGVGVLRRPVDPENMKMCFDMLLKAGCDLDATDDHGKTLLHHIAAPGTPNFRDYCLLFELLLKNGANVMARDKSGNTPLHMVDLGIKPAVFTELLLSHGADLTVRRDDGKTPLHTMCDTRQSLDLKYLLPYVKDWNVPDSEGNTVLHIILKQSPEREQAIKLLIKAGANPNQRNQNGLFPLHLMRNSSGLAISTVKALLEAGADLDARDYDGRTLLLRTLASGIPSDLQNAPPLVELGADIHAIDYEGNGVLHTLCKVRLSDNKSIIQELLKAGADPLRVNYAGNTLLHEIVTCYRTGNVLGVVKLLIEIGVPPRARNNRGQTAFHFVAACLPPNTDGTKASPLDFFLESEIGADINSKDNNGIRPIHLAATVSEEVVSKLIDCGADATATTHEGKTILHIAARSRQSNIIGLVLEHFSVINRLDLIDATDAVGRTALHHACRSGRPETVAFLLKAGANSNAKDKEGSTPLHVCSEFKEEQKLWSPGKRQSKREIIVDACGVLNRDQSRPTRRVYFGQSHPERSDMWDIITVEDDTVRIPEIIHMLLAHGAEICARDKQSSLPIDAATRVGCEEVVRELSWLNETLYTQIGEEKTNKYRSLEKSYLSQFKEGYLSLRSKSLSGFLAAGIKKGQYVSVCDELLALGEFDALKSLPGMGIKFWPPENTFSRTGDFLSTLSRWGYADLLESLGSTIEDPTWVNGETVPEDVPCSQRKEAQPHIITAADSPLPNLDVIKILVEKFAANMNIQLLNPVYKRGRSCNDVPGDTALHILALGKHWWQLKAMEYLLQHGANPEVKNLFGQTVLHFAVSPNNYSCGYLKEKSVKLLLEYGADPNAIDEKGLTCLNKATYSFELVRMLIKAGADVGLGENPILFSVIDAGDAAMLKVVLEAGANPNTGTKDPQKRKGWKPGMQQTMAFPVHYAALSRDCHEITILHDIICSGIRAPFLEIPNLDLERRDAGGRTLLLAACSSCEGTYSRIDYGAHDPGDTRLLAQRQEEMTEDDPSPAMTLYKMGANLTAISADGNNALHYLLVATPHNSKQYQKTFSLFINKAPNLIHQKNNEGNKPFHIAIQKLKKWSAKALMDAGADPKEKDSQGNTPLHYLVLRLFLDRDGLLPLFRELLSKGISINEINDRGETPVFGYFRISSRQRGQEATKKGLNLLLEAGADVFARNKDGETLLHVVAKKVFGNMMETMESEKDAVHSFKLLLELGLDPMVEDNEQRTALDVAAAGNGNKGILDLFRRGEKDIEREVETNFVMFD